MGQATHHVYWPGNTFSRPPLTARKTGKCSLAVCPKGKGNGLGRDWIVISVMQGKSVMSLLGPQMKLSNHQLAHAWEEPMPSPF
jgi:hypothetical protein